MLKKKITIIAVNQNGEEIINKTLFTHNQTLEKVLLELEDIEVIIEYSIQGSYVTELNGVKQGTNGPWWVFESETNNECIKNGYCPAIDKVAVQEEDVFIFKLIN